MRHTTDLHTHTLASGHAYSTIAEMVKGAEEAGLELLGITEHAPSMPGACHPMYFENFKVIDRERFPLEVWFGAELNILDYRGTVDLPAATLKKLDHCVASIHITCFHSGSASQNTDAYLAAMENPYINIIGHPDDARFPVDYYRLVKGARDTGTVLEMNSSSLQPGGARQGARENYQEMLHYCMEMQVPILINSDAHYYTFVGAHEEAHRILAGMGFPQELVLSTSAEKVKKYLKKKQ